MPLTILIIVVFVTVALAVFAFGAAVVTPTSVLGACEPWAARRRKLPRSRW